MPNMNKLLNAYCHLTNKKLFLIVFLMMAFTNIFAQDAATSTATPVVAESSMWSSPLFWVFVFAIGALLLVIVAIDSVLVGLVNNKISEKFGKGAAIIAIA